jgi:hypothetical protein
MPGNGKVYVCHAFQDNERCRPLRDALTSWGVDHWFAEQREEADETLSPRVERAIADRDIFVRIGSTAAEKSHWVRLETETFRRLQDEAREQGDDAGNRLLIHLLLDSGHEPAVAAGDVAVDASLPVGLHHRWRGELRRALGIERPAEETAEMPSLSSEEALREVMRWARERRARTEDDKVVSVAIAGRPTDDSAIAGGRPAILEVVEGSDAGRKYELPAAGLTLGRSRDCDLFLMDLRVSRKHAAIVRDAEGHYVLRDQNSTNGTWVNGHPVTEHILEDGDTIKLGATVLAIRMPHTND